MFKLIKKTGTDKGIAVLPAILIKISSVLFAWKINEKE
jgi:hypothetical protein